MAASAEFLGLDDSWPSLRSAMNDLGLEPEVRCWEDSDADWEHFALVVAMYTWGYVTLRHEFLAWTKRIEERTTLVNSAAHIQWSSDKRYLQDLSAKGVPVVPTSWARPGEAWSPPAEDYVVKPCVASGGLGAARYRDSSWDLAQAHVRRLHEAGHTVMVQPYQDSVDISGETAVVFIGDRISHAVQKNALLVADVGEVERLWEREVICPIEATSEQRQVANAALAAAVDRFGPTAYARVDLVEDHRGGAQVLEVELIEPSLFLAAAEGSAGRLAEVLYGLAQQQAAGSTPRPAIPGN
jgi:glutathione synthase/RimK-type ligase-like ATP-grasp enzyme